MTMDNGAARVEHIMNDPLAGGAREAYQALKQDLEQYASTHSEKQTEKYWNQMSADLNRAGVLPGLSVAWAEQERQVLDTNRDGLIDRTEVRQQQSGAIDHVFADQLLAKQEKRDLFDLIARQAPGQDRDHVDQADFDVYMHRQHKQAEKIRKTDNARDAMAPLLEGDEPLMAVLDRNHNGRISRRDMKVFLKDYKEHQGEGPYTPENAEYVKKLLEHNVPEIDRGPFGPGFSTNKMARKGDFDKTFVTEPEDYYSVQNSYDQKNMERTRQQTVGIGDGEAEETTPHHREGADQTPKRTENWSKPEPGSFEEHVQEMCTVRPGEGYWHTSARLLNIDIGPKGLDSSPQENSSIWNLTKQIADVDGATIDAHGKAHPVLKPGDVIAVGPNMDELFSRNQDLANAMRAMRYKWDEEHGNNVEYLKSNAAAEAEDDYED